MTASGFKIKRSLLKDQIADLLRENILVGKITQGTRMVERDIADMLEVSRVPVRDALLQLEVEGLVESTPGGRQVIELTEDDLVQLHQVRSILEKLAVDLFLTRHHDCAIAELEKHLEQMRDAAKRRDLSAFVDGDIAMHRLLWKESGNKHLERILNSLLGPISIVISSHAVKFNWDKTLMLHEDLLACVCANNLSTAERSIDLHMEDSLNRSLENCQIHAEEHKSIIMSELQQVLSNE